MPPVTRKLDGSVDIDAAAFVQWIFEQRQLEIDAGLIPTPQNKALFDLAAELVKAGGHELTMAFLLAQIILRSGSPEERALVVSGLMSFPIIQPLVAQFVQMNASPIIQSAPPGFIH
jgi:hypothetical protein